MWGDSCGKSQTYREKKPFKTHDMYKIRLKNMKIHRISVTIGSKKWMIYYICYCSCCFLFTFCVSPPPPPLHSLFVPSFFINSKIIELFSSPHLASLFVCLFFSTASSVAPRCWIQDSKFYIQEAFTSVPPSHHSFPYIRDQFCHDNCLLIDVCLHCSSCLRFRIFSIHFYQQQQQSHTKGAWEMEREKRFSKFNRTINHHHLHLINSCI